VSSVVADRADPDLGSLPQIIVSYLRDGDIEPVSYPVGQLPKDVALSFQRMVLWNADIELTDTDNHNPLTFLPLHNLRKARSNLFHLVGFDDISRFDIVEILNPNSTLEPLAAILHVILETPQGSDPAIKDHDIVS